MSKANKGPCFPFGEVPDIAGGSVCSTGRPPSPRPTQAVSSPPPHLPGLSPMGSRMDAQQLVGQPGAVLSPVLGKADGKQIFPWSACFP